MMQKRFLIKRVLLSLLALLSVFAGAKAQDMLSTPLTFEAVSEGDITFTIAYSYTHPVVLTPVEYQINDGSWTTYASWPADAASITSSTGNWPVTFGDPIHVAAGDKVAFRGNNASYYGNGTGYECHITSTANVYVYGNVMSLVNSTDFATLKTLTGSWNFGYLFSLPKEHAYDPPITVTTIKSHPTKDIVLPATTLTDNCYWAMFAGCKGITRAPELPATTMTGSCYTQMFRATGLTAAPALPATVMQPYSYDPETYVETLGSIDCYMQMFQDCTDLTVAPELPATTLTHGVYQNMFEGCTSLVNAPALPATDLTGADQCYTAMFKGCTSLITAPALPATKLDQWCYMEMFSGCTSLVNAPALPATTLPADCYHRMFEGCTSLKKAPVLPAPTVTDQTYGGMFDGCTSLNYVKCLAVNIVDTSHGEDATTDCWLANVSPTGTFVKADAADWSVKTKTGAAINGIPAGWTVVNASEEVASMTETPLTIEATEDATTVTITNPLTLTIEYSTNGGTSWTTASDATITISGISAGQTVQLRGNNTAYSSDGTTANSMRIAGDKDYYVYGNVMSLVNSNDFSTLTTLTGNYAFARLFLNDAHLRNHATKELVLPATTLTDYCYYFMFYGCKGMTTAPALPATTMAPYCYSNMFGFCHALTATPDLPATTLADYCYYRMFLGSNGLTTITSLPATVMAPYCYNEMFRQCGALTIAPSLPSTTMADYCYRCMFQACKSLTAAPALPASTLAKGCYLGMFVNTALTSAPELPATTLAESCYYQMFQNNPELLSYPALPATVLPKLCYYKMFADCPKLVTAGDLAATSVGESSCEYMFMNCTALETAPALPATTLAATCYNYMFSGCTSLVNAPALPATTLAVQCYQRMFEECHSLVTAPELSATNLADLCYNDMFWNCTSLKNAPVLPATKLAPYCYTMMFFGCSSLETAPDLIAPTLVGNCYEHMFMNCTSLNYVKCLATDLGDDTATDGWLTNVAAAGTFVKAPGIEWSGKGTTEGTDFDDPSKPLTFVHGIPAGWTVETSPIIYAHLNSDGEGNYWATFYNESAGFTADATTSVYTAKVSTDKSKIELTEVSDKVIPAGNAVILKSTAASITMTYAEDATGTLAGNELQGSATAIATPANTYMLAKGTQGVGFYHWTEADIPANRGYIILATGARPFLGLGDSETTTVETIEAISRENAPLYDMTGRRVTGKTTPGIYVKRSADGRLQGKKIIIK